LSELGNPFDSARMSVGWCGSMGRPIPRHGPLDTFLRGPIPWPWWSRAASLPGRALHVASAVRYLVGWKGEPTVSLALGDLDPFLGVDHQAARRGLRALESVALVEVEPRAGCKLLVRVCEVEDASDRRQLRGPIPWPWWVRACRLPGRALHVASTIWAVVGWNGGRSATCEFRLNGCADFGVGRKAVKFGMCALESDGLILVSSRLGRPAIVTLLPVSTALEGRGNRSSLIENDLQIEHDADSGYRGLHTG
jgi:hypothetical protein